MERCDNGFEEPNKSCDKAQVGESSPGVQLDEQRVLNGGDQPDAEVDRRSGEDGDGGLGQASDHRGFLSEEKDEGVRGSSNAEEWEERVDGSGLKEGREQDRVCSQGLSPDEQGVQARGDIPNPAREGEGQHGGEHSPDSDGGQGDKEGGEHFSEQIRNRGHPRPGGDIQGIEEWNKGCTEHAGSKDTSTRQADKGRETPDGLQRPKESPFRCVWTNDWEYADFKWAINKKTGKKEWKGQRNLSGKVYRKHWNDGTYVDADIRAVDPDTIPDFDLLTGGVPCQAWSVAGKRGGFEDARGTLWFEVFRILKAKQPSFFLLENVKGILSADKGRSFELIMENLCECGYVVDFTELNSKYFGVPQNRQRIYILGIRSDIIDKKLVI